MIAPSRKVGQATADSGLEGSPPEYFLIRNPSKTNGWILCAGHEPIQLAPWDLLPAVHPPATIIWCIDNE
jgi:hypothetical protein